MPKTGFASWVVGLLYESLCCPDPCYQPKWMPLADSAFFTDSARPVSHSRLRWEYGPEARLMDRAAASLGEYLVKGFVMDDARLKEPDTDYFDELLARIRDIRSSEKQFYKKVLEIYATSIDYDPKAEASATFFKTVQNKMHYAAHGHTAAEIVHSRADAAKDHMGMTSWAAQAQGGLPRKTDATIAKNYLGDGELEPLNRIVTAYLEFAEVQAMGRRPMHMADWIAKLDDFLKLSDREVLSGAGRISASAAKEKAERVFDAWHTRAINAPSAVEQHFADAIGATKKIAAAKKRTRDAN